MKNRSIVRSKSENADAQIGKAGSRSKAIFTPGSAQSAKDKNQELVKLLEAPRVYRQIVKITRQSKIYEHPSGWLITENPDSIASTNEINVLIKLLIDQWSNMNIDNIELIKMENYYGWDVTYGAENGITKTSFQEIVE